jgi:hypothetical protein
MRFHPLAEVLQYDTRHKNTHITRNKTPRSNITRHTKLRNLFQSNLSNLLQGYWNGRFSFKVFQRKVQHECISPARTKLSQPCKGPQQTTDEGSEMQSFEGMISDVVTNVFGPCCSANRKDDDPTQLSRVQRRGPRLPQLQNPPAESGRCT